MKKGEKFSRSNTKIIRPGLGLEQNITEVFWVKNH